MGILKTLFGSRTTNVVQDVAGLLEREAKGLIESQQMRFFSFNSANHLSFLIAELCFALETKPNFDKLTLLADYESFISTEKNKKAFQLIFKYIMNYYRGDPSLDKALLNLTAAYFATVWSAPAEILTNPLSLVQLSLILTNVRMVASQFIEERIIPTITENA